MVERARKHKTALEALKVVENCAVALIFSVFWAWNGDAKGATLALAFVACIWGEELPWRSLARFFKF